MFNNSYTCILISLYFVGENHFLSSIFCTNCVTNFSYTCTFLDTFVTDVACFCIIYQCLSGTRCPHSDLEAHLCGPSLNFSNDNVLMVYNFSFFSSLRLQTTSDVSLIINDCYFVNLAGIFSCPF